MLLRVLVTVLLLLGEPCLTWESDSCNLSQVGHVRLAGDGGYAGVVEVCHHFYLSGNVYYTYWLPLCNYFNSWDSTTAGLVCKALNFSTSQTYSE